ncbi:unnamed protein product, partial [Rhizoctonia solani]
ARLAMRKRMTDENSKPNDPPPRISLTFVEPKCDISEVEKATPRKIRRTVTQSARRRRRKKSAKSLSGFVNIPLDIFTEIASYLFPNDIFSLSYLSKLFRDLIMCQSSRHIWTNAMRNVEMLPPCPSDMSEPAYLAILFSKYCTAYRTNIHLGMWPPSQRIPYIWRTAYATVYTMSRSTTYILEYIAFRARRLGAQSKNIPQGYETVGV